MKTSSLKSQSGQMLVESILILSVLLTFFLILVTQLRNQQVAAQLVHAPWVHLSGLLQNGVWGPSQNHLGAHPENSSRQRTLEGEFL